MQELWYRPIVLLIVLAGIYFTVRTNRVFSQNLHNDTDVSFLFNRCDRPLRRAYAAGILMQAGESICFPFMIMLRMAIAAGGAGAIVWFAVFSLLLKCVQGAMGALGAYYGRAGSAAALVICSAKRKGIGTILIGFAVLMTGMTTMSSAVAPLQNETWFTNLFVRFSNPLLGVLVGAIVTGIIQSSSASVGILQALSSTGVITYGSAIPIIMGQNIGTCVTALISSVGANKNARRAAMVHLYFNIIGVTLFLAVFYGLNLVLDFSFIHETVTPWGIAVVHSIFNLTATAVLLPFANGLEKLAILTIPDDAEKESFALLDERLLKTPAVAVERARAATAEMAELARVGVVQAMSLTHTWDDTLAQKVRDEEQKVDQYEDALGTYLVKLSSRELSHADSQSVNTLLHTISDFERISDHSVNLLSSAEEIHSKNIEFSKDAREELQVLEGAVQDVLSRTTDAFRKDDLHLAGKVEPMETVVDELVRAIKARHVARLQAGSCSIEYGFVLEDLLTNYERVCDHCSNVAVAQIEVAQDSFDTHAYLNDLRYGNDTKESEQFRRRLDRYRERYLFPDGEPAVASEKEEPNK